VPTSVFTPEYTLFLRHFHEARKSAGLSQEEAATRMGKPQSYISKCQTGERRVDVIELYNYCEALGISFAEFTQELEKALKQANTQ
jgi:transcriptional regulator with XRE-family HTH domain